MGPLPTHAKHVTQHISKQGEAEFSALFHAHCPAVRAFLRRRVPGNSADDLTAETFARAWKNYGSLKGQPLPWLYGIARNVMREFYRTRPEEDATDVIELDPQRADFSTLVDMSIDINRALGTLSAPDREILTLHAWEGLSPAELAAALGISSTAARVRLHRARTRLEDALTADSGPAPSSEKP